MYTHPSTLATLVNSAHQHLTGSYWIKSDKWTNASNVYNSEKTRVW